MLSSLLVSALFLTSAAFAQTTPSSQCPTGSGIHVIAVSGDKQPPFGYGLLGNLSDSILSVIPGSTSISVPYDKNNTNQLVATTTGAVNFTDYVNQFHASCPCSKVAVIGYSAGAIIAMNSLCGVSSPWTSPAQGFNTSYEKFIIGAVVYGDETRTAGVSYDLGTCTGNGRYPRTSSNSACPNFASRIQSYCVTDDPQCCLGSNSSSHFIYDMMYDGTSSNWVKSQAASFGSICSSTSTSSKPTTSTTSIRTSTTLAVRTSTTTTAKPTTTTTSKTCPTALSGNYQYPHLIVPVNSKYPGSAYGTQYNGLVNTTDASIFNFDIPSSYSGLTCTVFFDFPIASQLKYSSFTTSGAPGVSFALLNGVATSSTTYANQPGVATSYGSFTMTPGTNVIFTSGPCAGGKTLSYKMSATGNYALEYFQTTAAPPIGLYMTAC